MPQYLERMQLAPQTSSRQALTSGASGSNGGNGIITADRHAANVAITQELLFANQACAINRPVALSGDGTDP
jgi:hypothetical protein